MERTCVRDSSAPRGRTQDRSSNARAEMFATRRSARPPPPRTVVAMAIGAAPDRAAGAPLSYLGGRSFVDDRSLLLELFTAVLTASEGERAVALHERAAAPGKRSRAGSPAATPGREEHPAPLSPARPPVPPC